MRGSGNGVCRNRAVGAAITALQQLEGAIRKLDPRLEELGTGLRALDVRLLAISLLHQSTAMTENPC